MKTLTTKKTENMLTNVRPYLSNTVEFGWSLCGTTNPLQLNMTGGSIAKES